jgi:SAM-dependent methyltransferase
VVVEARRRDGLRVAATLARKRLVGATQAAAAVIFEWMVDTRYGISTRGVLENSDVLDAAAQVPDGYAYQASPLGKFRRLIAASGVTPSETSFVDLGCGRGRALVLAAELGFRTVIGVELDPVLAEQAEENVTRWIGARSAGQDDGRKFSVQRCDAASIALPTGAVIVYLYNPFGSETLNRVLDVIIPAASTGLSSVTLCYYNPVHANVIAMRPQAHLLRRGRDWAVFTFCP